MIGASTIAIAAPARARSLSAPRSCCCSPSTSRSAGSHFAISLPTTFVRYSRDRSFEVLCANKGFVLAMVAGSIIGTILGGLVLGAVPKGVLIPLLVALLLVSSVKVWRHD